VIDAINALDIGVEARINETGDGLLLGDTAGGTGTLLIVDQGGTTARDLNLLSTPVDGKIDGSYEFKIDTSEAATLNDVASRIQATMLASASLLHDGSATAPYRLSVTSRAGGRNGELILDDGAGLLALTTMTRAQDARVLLGSTLDGGILVTSPSNTLTNTVQGVTLNLSGVDDQPVTITVNRDADSLVSTLKDLVNDYNNLSDRMDQLGGYNADTQTGGVLLGDATLQLVENRLFRAFSGSVPGATGTLTRLSQLGVRVGETGLTFDEAKFREVYNADPEAVTRFFTAVEGGLAPQLKESLQRITETGGLLKRQDAALQDQKELLSDRVDQLNALLQTKRERLLNQFRSMEQALAQLQSQQSVLGSFTDLLTSLGALDG
jgi:flagellar hook-associated protein 2